MCTTLLCGCLYLVHWTCDWTMGLDCGTGLTSCAHLISKQHTHYCTTVYLHNMNSISISLGPDKVSAAISAGVHAIQICVPALMQPNKHWPLSNGSTVNMHSCTLISSSKQSHPSGKSPCVHLH